MGTSKDASALLNSLMKEVSEKQWETYKRKRRIGDLVTSEVMSDTDGSPESEDEIEVNFPDDNEIFGQQFYPASTSTDTNIAQDLLIKKYMDNQISFDELENVMEKGIRKVDEDLEVTDEAETITQIEERLSIEEEDSDPEWVPDTSKKRKSKNFQETGKVRARKSKLPRDLMGLVGQANLYFAQGLHEDAIAMCSEVIRQAPTAPEPFQTLGMLYEEMGQVEKAFQFNLIAAYLCPSDGEHWTKCAEMAIEQEKYQQAVKCLTKAIKLNRSNLELHLERCHLFEKIGDSKKALEGYTSMLKELNSDKGEYALMLAKEIAKIHYSNNNLSSSLSVMESTFAKFYEFATIEDVNLYLELLIIKKLFLESLKCFNDYCGVVFTIANKTIDSFEQSYWDSITKDQVDVVLPSGFVAVDLRSKLIVCLINLRCISPVKNLIREITIRSAEEMSDLYLDIADAYAGIGMHSDAEPLLAALVVAKTNRHAHVWLRYAQCLHQLDKIDEAINAYHEVTKRDSENHEAKIQLTSLLIKVGRPEDATSVSDQDNSSLVNTELLKMRCDLLYRQEMWKDFVQAVKLLLRGEMEFLTHERELQVMTGASGFSRRLENLGEIRHELNIESIQQSDFNFVGKRLDFQEFINFYLRLCQVITEKLHDDEELVRVSLSLFTSPFSEGEFAKYIEFYGFMGLFEARDERHLYKVAKSLIKKVPKNNQVWNIFSAIINVIYQDLRHNKFCLRQLVKAPESIILSYLNGHNSLMSGSYKFALDDYVNIHKVNPNDPLVIFCIGLCFLHIASQKFVKNQHSVVLQMCSFLDIYMSIRGECQEVFYNIGRAFHQLNLLNEATHFYLKALDCTDFIEINSDSDRERFDLRKEIAFNLSLIFRNSGSNKLARYYLKKYLVV